MVPDETIHLIITSPPYPMIKMWDEIFSDINSNIGEYLKQSNATDTFLLMHDELDLVWRECYRVLKPGGILCVNIGDATRTIGGKFQLFSNHAQVINRCLQHGYVNLPNIIWRKPTNSPTKFMGSGMLPPGAYVTLEHEYILIFRKGSKREFRAASDKRRRRESAIFWEERNRWFSDIWTNLTGARQNMGQDAPRSRSAAFPLELAFRLVNMFSIKDDSILDPFMGTGTTNIAGMLCARNSIGLDINSNFRRNLKHKIADLVPLSEQKVQSRLREHVNFIETRESEGRNISHTNKHYNLPVVSSQESEIQFYKVKKYVIDGTTITVEHEKYLME